MASQGSNPPLELYRDNTVHLFQFIYVFFKLLPKHLPEMFKLYVVKYDAFQSAGKKVDGKVTWHENQKRWLLDQIKTKKLCNVGKTLIDRPFEEWDTPAYCAALIAVTTPSVKNGYRREDIAKFPIAAKADKVKSARDTVSHTSLAEISDDDFQGHMQSVQSLIEQAQSDFPEVGVWAGFLEELERTADIEAFKKRFRNVKEVTEFSTLLEHIMKDKELGEELRKDVETLHRSLMGILRGLQCGQQEILQGQEDLQRSLQGMKEDLRRGLEGMQQSVEGIRHANQVQSAGPPSAQPIVIIAGNTVTGSSINVGFGGPPPVGGPDPTVRDPPIIIHDIREKYTELKGKFVDLCVAQGSPTLDEVKEYCIDLIQGCFSKVPRVVRHEGDIEAAETLTKLARVVCFHLSNWVSYDFFKKVVAHFKPALRSVEEEIGQYEKQLKPLLVQKLEYIADLQKQEKPPESMAELVVRYRLNADGLLVKDLIAERDFLAQRLDFPEHLLQVLSWGDGSIVITYWILRDLLPFVELALCRENVREELIQHGVVDVYLDSHPSDHPGLVDLSLQTVHLKRRAIVTVLGAHRQDMDVASLTSDLQNMGIVTTEQYQKLTSLSDEKQVHEALLYILLAHNGSDTYHKLVECMEIKYPSIAEDLQAAIDELKSSRSVLNVIGNSQFSQIPSGPCPHSGSDLTSSKPKKVAASSTVSTQKNLVSKYTSSQPQAKRSRPCHVWHPLENEFQRVMDTTLKVLNANQLPSLDDLKKYCCHMVTTSDEELQSCIARELETAQSYEAVVGILFQKLCKWLSFSLLEMILDYFHDYLGEVRVQLEVYKKQLEEALQKPLIQAEEYLNQAGPPPVAMQKMYVRCLLEAKRITPEDIIAYRQFLSSSLSIPFQLLVLISSLYGSLLLELWIPEELSYQVVRRVEEVWRELLRRKVEGIEVGDWSFDLLQQSNVEKLSLITSSLLVATAAEPWQDVLSPYGTRLYEEYGRHESLQLCVKKYKEAGRPSPEALGALEWLLLHHTPEVAEREGKDPLDVLLTTVFMGCCDVDRFVSAVVKCLKDDPSVQTRLHKASKGYVRAQHDMPLTPVTLMLIFYLFDGAVTKLYLKYCHLPSLQAHISPGVKDPQHLSREEAQRVKRWFRDHMMEKPSLSSPLPVILIEAGVTDEEIKPVLSMEGEPQDPVMAKYYQLMAADIATARRLSMMKKSFQYSQEDVRVLQSSFRMYLACAKNISPDALLQSANSQRRDIFRLFFEALEEQKVDTEWYKSHLRGEVPVYYQQDLEQAFASPAGAVAMETSATSNIQQVPVTSSTGPTPASPTSSSSEDSAHSSHLSEGKKQFALLVADMLPTVTKQIAPLANHFASLPVGSTGVTIFSAEQALTAARNLPRYWSWYECTFLKEVTGYFHSKEAAMSTLLETYDAVKLMSLPECFPQGPLTANQLAPPPGYTPLRLTLPNHPEDVSMGRLWSLKEQLCSSLALQPYALLLKGYMEGSTHIIFHISQHVTLDEDQVAAMFVVAKRAGLYPHSITTGFSTAQEVEYHLMDILPLVKMRKVKGQMEGLTIAEKEQPSATEAANDQ